MATTGYQHTRHQNIHGSDNPYLDYQDTTTTNAPYYSRDTNVSASKVAAVVTLFPLGGTLLFLSGLILAATVIGLALATPLFVVFSPVLVPATLAAALIVSGFMASGAFGVAAMSALAWMARYIRRLGDRDGRDGMEYVKRRGEDALDYVGQKTKDAGQGMQNKAHEGWSTGGPYSTQAYT